MPRHSTTSNVEWASMHELETIADSLETVAGAVGLKGSSHVCLLLERIAIALETIAAKP